MLYSNVLSPLMPRRAPAVLSEMAPLKTDGALDRRGIGVPFHKNRRDSDTKLNWAYVNA